MGKVADDAFVSSKLRDNAETGSISLTVPNGSVVQLYVHYVMEDQVTIITKS